MTSNRDPNEPVDGVKVDLPFISFRIGRGGAWGWYSAMNHDDAYERARRRVRARLSFYRHLATYAAVIAGIAFVDLITGGGISNVVLWFAGIWGAFLVWQGFNVFIFPAVWSPEAEEKMIEDELRKDQRT
ncbi:MAG: hypothetical protein GEU75_15055 [Dehalococcoidia bacterium]|nr:hypothetical protein [Dehalococcoidia bacterium]